MSEAKVIPRFVENASRKHFHLSRRNGRGLSVLDSNSFQSDSGVQQILASETSNRPTIQLLLSESAQAKESKKPREDGSWGFIKELYDIHDRLYGEGGRERIISEKLLEFTKQRLEQ